MNCPEIRAALPLWHYGDLPAETVVAVEYHLTVCGDCRAAAEGLRTVRAALAAVHEPTPVAVDLPRLYQEAAARQAVRLRRWRRAAVAVGAVAAALFLVVGLRLEVRAEAKQLVVRWGGGPEPVPVVAKQPEKDERLAGTAVLPDDDRVRVLQELVHALADELDHRDDRQRAEFVRWQGDIERLHWRTVRRLESTESDVRALYTAQFGPRGNPGGQ